MRTVQWDAEAVGNTFFLVMEDERTEQELEEIRQRGLWTFDTALVVREDAGAVRMRVIERDRSESTMCGNGLRAVARALDKIGRPRRVIAGGREFEIDRTREGRYRVPMGEVEWLGPFRLPPPHLAPTFALVAAGGEPHAVALVQDVHRVPLTQWGRAIAPMANTTVVARDGTRLRARTYERGVNAITGSCGTGATSAAAVALFNSSWARASVLMDAGELVLHHTNRGLILEGDARINRRGR